MAGVGGVGALTGTGTGSLSGTVNLATATSIGGAGTLTLSGVVSGNALTKVGNGTLILSKAATYSGGTTISAGTLKNGVANALPTTQALTVSSPGIYDVNGFAQTIGSLAGSGAVNDSGAAVTLQTGSDNTSTSFSGTINNGLALTNKVQARSH